MTIHATQLEHAGLTGTGDREGKRRYTALYHVWADPSDGVMVVGNLWTRGSYYTVNGDVDTGAIISDVTPRKISNLANGQSLWEVTVNYSTVGGDPAKEQSNPLDMPIQLEYGFADYLDYPGEDLDGQPFTTTAGERYEADAAAIEMSYLTLTVTKNLATFSVSAALEFQNTVNASPFYGGDAETVLCKSIRASNRYENGVNYWQVVYEFHYKPGGWRRQILNAGSFHKVAGVKRYNRVADPDDPSKTRATTSPMALTISGGLLPDGDPEVFQSFRVYASKNFNLLGLGS
jgi:hypothetical protein